ncbi:MAG: HAD hydrolase-like protein, partial [Ruthenibacterium sp.]
ALFAQQIDLPFRAFSCKPSPIGLAAARRAFGVKKSEIALVGDQIFTDVLGANLYGIPMLLVQPMYADYKPTIRLKRWLEKPVLARYYKRGGKLIQREET